MTSYNSQIRTDSHSRRGRGQLVVLVCLGLLLLSTMLPAAVGVSVALSQGVVDHPPIQAQAGEPTPTATSNTSTEPIATVKGVELAYEHDGARLSLTVTVQVVKLNESTVLIRHQHNQTVKKWYTTADSVVNHAAFAGGTGTTNEMLKDHLANEIEATPLFKTTIKPYVRSHHKTGKEGYRQLGREHQKAFNKMLPDVPGPVEAMKDIYTWFVNGIANGVKTLVDALHWVVLHLPAPGNPHQPSTWYPGYVSPVNSSTPENNTTTALNSESSGTSSATRRRLAPSARSAANSSPGNHPSPVNATNATGIPTSPPNQIEVNGWWKAVWTVYGGLASLVSLPVIVAWIYAWARKDETGREREQRLYRIGLTLAMIVGGIVFLPFILHLTNTIAFGIVPDGETFLATPGNVAKLSVGLLIGGAVMVFESGLVAVSLVVLFVQWVLVFFIVAVWPLIALCLGSNNQYLKPYGHSGLFAFVSLILLKLIQAVWLRFLIELPISSGEIVTSVLTMVFIAIGVLLGFIYLPYYTTTNILPEVVNMVGKPAVTGSGHTRYHSQLLSDDDVSSSSRTGGSERVTQSNSVDQSSSAGQSQSRTQSRPVAGAGDGDSSSPMADEPGVQTTLESESQNPHGRSWRRARRVTVQREQFDPTHASRYPEDKWPDRDPTAGDRDYQEPPGGTGSRGRVDRAIGLAENATETVENVGGKAGTALAFVADARRTTKAHWHSAKRWWTNALPDTPTRRRRGPRPALTLTRKIHGQATKRWENTKEHRQTLKSRWLERSHHQRREQRREHVREQRSDDEDEDDADTTDT